MLQPNFDPAPTRFALIAANTFRSAEREVASSARRWSRRRSIPLVVTFAKSNCARCTAKSSSSASESADLRFATDENLVDARSNALNNSDASDSAIRRITATVEPLLALKSKAEENAETL